MRLVRNTGNGRVVDLIRPSLGTGQQLDVETSALSLFAFAELLEPLESLDCGRPRPTAVTETPYG